MPALKRVAVFAFAAPLQSLNRVRVQETLQHTPIQNSREYPPPPSGVCNMQLKTKVLSLTDVCIRHNPSHTNICKFFIFQLSFSQLILHLIC